MTRIQRNVCRTFAAAVLVVALPLAAQRGGRAGGAGASQPPPPPGDAANGKALYDTNKCADCHRIRETGSRFGPDLTNIGALRSPDQLEQAIVAPDEDVQPDARHVRIVLKDGTAITGRIINQDAFTVQLITSKEELKSYPRAGLREYTIVDKGLMPSYKGKLTPQQVNDLVNYLASLKGAS